MTGLVPELGPVGRAGVRREFLRAVGRAVRTDADDRAPRVLLAARLVLVVLEVLQGRDGLVPPGAVDRANAVLRPVRPVGGTYSPPAHVEGAVLAARADGVELH